MSLGDIEKGTAGIKKQAKELIEQAYLRGYKAGRESSLDDWIKTVDVNDLVEQGRNEAWNAARKLFLNEENGGLNQEDFVSLFDGKRPVMVLAYTSASEVIAKIKAYEEQKKQEQDKMKIGDEVTFPGGTKLIIIGLTENGKFDGLYTNGDGVDTALDKSQVTKTGRTFPEIAEFMKKLKDGDK